MERQRENRGGQPRLHERVLGGHRRQRNRTGEQDSIDDMRDHPHLARGELARGRHRAQAAQEEQAEARDDGADVHVPEGKVTHCPNVQPWLPATAAPTVSRLRINSAQCIRAMKANVPSGSRCARA